MLEKLLLYDNQQPRLLIMLRNMIIVRFIDYPKGVLALMLGNGGKLFILMIIIGNILKNSLRYSQVHGESHDVAQGSTYDSVFVDLNNMVFDKFNQPYSDQDDLLRRIYVSCSRARKELIINYGS